MQIIPILFFLLALFLIIFIKRNHHLSILKKVDFIREKYHDKILLEKNNVNCISSTSGLKNGKYVFKKCNLIIIDNILVIISFYKIWNKKVYTNAIFIENNTVLGYGEVKRFNPNSFNGDAYIEFGNSNLTSTSVTIRLKELNSGEKTLIPIKQSLA